jgi:hypothetical protein
VTTLFQIRLTEYYYHLRIRMLGDSHVRVKHEVNVSVSSDPEDVGWFCCVALVRGKIHSSMHGSGEQSTLGPSLASSPSQFSSRDATSLNRFLYSTAKMVLVARQRN